MNPTKRFKAVATLALALTAATAQAEDIDIYQGIPAGGAPNLLIILDNAAAADASSSYTCSALRVNDPGKNLGFEQCGLYSAVSEIGSNPALNGNINLGLMYFPGGGTGGGKFVLPTASPAPSALLTMDGTGSDGKGLNQMLTRISQLSLSADKANNNQISQAMQEAWAFYVGKTGLSGTTYPGVTAASNCAKNYVLYVTLATNNQKPQDGGQLAAGALQTAMNLPLAPTNFALPNWRSPVSGSLASSKYRTDPSDEWASFMYAGTSARLNTTYPGIITYTIILSDGSNPDYEQLMVSMANQGNGKYFIVKLGDVSGLADAFGKVFAEVQATNSVFAAPVLPISANTQGTYLNQVYIGMFRPDGTDKPRWMGNLKQYRFGVDSSDPVAPALFLGDAAWPGTGGYPGNTDAYRALSAAGTGFITPGAISFWTSKDTSKLPDSASGFWVNAIKLQGGVDGFDAADGQIVEKGGVGQQIRLRHLSDTYPATSAATATTSRNVYTCPPSGCSSNSALSGNAFSVGNQSLNASALGIPSSSTITPANLINWVRGEDTAAQVPDTVAGAETSAPPATSITVRGSVHGDVLHSRPAVINYGGSTGVVVFYGANDGLFRAVNGNQPNNATNSSLPMGFCTVSSDCAISVVDAQGRSAAIPPGGELWSFVPPEFYPGLQRLYQNGPSVKMGSLTAGTPKDYFFDGSPSVYQDAASNKAYIYLSARRGGRLLYALDVSDPARPKFMWKISSTDSGFGELGQTWSQPKVARIRGHANPVLIFGAGYDAQEDKEPAGTDTMGRGVFIVDAFDGKLLWHAGPECSGGSGVCKLVAGMTYATPADITLVDRDFDGYIDRLYVADLGGNIWRVDLEPSGCATASDCDESKWTATQFASLGGTGTQKRKFFFPPDVVLTKNYDIVLAVTGDREHPLITAAANQTVNRFYMIKDTKVGRSAAGWTTVADATSSTANDAPTTLFNARTATYDGSLSGFYVSLLGLDSKGNTSRGEQGVNAPTTVGGVTYFGTNQPYTSTDTCQANLGKARAYGINFITGETKSAVKDGGGLLPSPVFGIVTVTVNGKEQQVPFLIGGVGGTGADSKSGLGAQTPSIPVKMKKRRTTWHRVIDR